MPLYRLTGTQPLELDGGVLLLPVAGRDEGISAATEYVQSLVADGLLEVVDPDATGPDPQPLLDPVYLRRGTDDQLSVRIGATTVPVDIQGPAGTPGPQGQAGTGITYKGQVASAAALTALISGASNGDAYTTADTLHLWIFNAVGGTFVDNGNVQGPQGVPGADGAKGDKGDKGDPGSLPGSITAALGVFANWPVAIQAAIDALPATGGSVLLPGGLVDYAGGTVPPRIPAGKPVAIRGAGKFATTIRLASSGARTAFSLPAAPTGRYDVELDGFGVDGNGLSGTSNLFYGVVLSNEGQINVDRLRLNRLRSFNVPALDTTRRNVDITINHNGPASADYFEVLEVKATDCDFLGGASGIGIKGFTAAANRTAAQYEVSTNPNVWIADALMERCTWDGGADPTGFAFICGFQVGAQGKCGRVTFRRLTARRSGDDCFEINSAQDVLIENCIGGDSVNETYYVNNNGGRPVQGIREQRWRVIGCRVERRNTGGAASGPGFWIHGLTATGGAQAGAAMGDVLLRDCHVMSTAKGALADAFKIIGAVNDVTIDRCSYTERGNPSVAFTTRGIYLSLLGGRGTVAVRDFKHDVDVTATHTTGAVVLTALGVDAWSDHELDVDGIDFRTRAPRTGAGTVNIRMVDFGTNTPALTDTFATAGTLTSDYRVDAGAGEVAVSTGALAPTNVASEKRLTWLASAVNTVNGGHGPVSDGSVSIKATPGPTLTGYKQGLALRVLDTDGVAQGSYLEGYITDNGTASALNIDKVVAGVRTNLATGAAGTRISNGTPYWLRFTQVGDLLTVDYLSAAPTGPTGGTVIATLGVSLSTGDAALLGSGGPQGRVGFTWTPQDTAARLDDFRRDMLGILRGRIRRVKVRRGNGAANASLVWRWLIGAPYYRLPARFAIEDSDMAGFVGQASLTETTIDSSLLGKLVFRRHRWLTPPAAAAVAPGASPYTYTSTDLTPELVAISGGTVSLVEYAPDGVTFAAIAAASNVQRMIEPGEALRVTYSAAPTIEKVPVPA